MELRDVDVDSLSGKTIGFFAVMNGGKTLSMVSELERVAHSGYNVIAYNPSSNTRETNRLMVDNRIEFPAKSVNNISELKKDFEHRSELIMSNDPKYAGENGIIVIDGIAHQKGVPIKAIGTDELNLFCLTEDDTHQVIDFLDSAQRNNIIIYVSGLLYDFRNNPFGNIIYVLPHIDIKEEKKPVCKAVHRQKQCGAPGMHTQRLWSLEYVKEQGLEELFSEKDFFDFARKDGSIITNAYVAAPFFDRTVRIEEARDGRIVYLPTCKCCSSVPYKDEVFKVYNAIISGVTPDVQSKLLKEIVHFLTDEQWINGTTAVAQYKNKIGGYSPRG